MISQSKAARCAEEKLQVKPLSWGSRSRIKICACNKQYVDIVTMTEKLNITQMCSSITLIVSLLVIPLVALGEPIQRVHLIFSNHLDIGFHSDLPDTPGTDSNVLSHYFKDYFPAAVAVAEEMRQRGGTERYRYLTHSFLVSLYLNDCPEKLGIYCPSTDEIAVFKNAILQGDIVWHAYPDNLQTEFLGDPGLLQYAVQLAHDLDRQFNLPPKRVISQRDVPGLTRAAIPILAQAGVAALSVGVNGGSAPPDVPKHNKPFLWKDEATGTSLIAFWHPGGYSGSSAENDPLDGPEDCVSVPGFNEVLCAVWRSDNAGPHSVDEIVDIYRRAEKNFPQAEVIASTYDDFILALENFLSTNTSTTVDSLLPVVNQEIGDTWIYGIASDPARVAEYRALLRLRRASDRWDEAAYLKFSRLLLKVPEHTWGVDTKEYPGDYSRWTNKELKNALESNVSGFRVAVESWQRQRAYTQWAVEELQESTKDNDILHKSIITEFHKEMEHLKSLPKNLPGSGGGHDISSSSSSPCRPSWEAQEEASGTNQGLVYESDAWRIGLDPSTGAISELVFLGGDKNNSNNNNSRNYRNSHTSGGGGDNRLPFNRYDHHSSINWASPDSLLAQIMYSTYSEDDYYAIWSHYSYTPPPVLVTDGWFYKDFGKPNSTVLGGAKSQDAYPTLQTVWQCDPSPMDHITTTTTATTTATTASSEKRRQEMGENSFHIVAQSYFKDESLVNKAGGPAQLFLEITSPADSTDLFIDVIMENKTATRLPEATWFKWQPAVHAVDTSSWTMSKLKQNISPLEVMRNGSMSMHAVDDEGISVRSACGKAMLKVSSLDAALVSPGKPTPFPTVEELPDLTAGMHFNLHNNIWGTNYVMWWPYQKGDETIRFRFVVQVEAVGGEARVAEE